MQRLFNYFVLFSFLALVTGYIFGTVYVLSLIAEIQNVALCVSLFFAVFFALAVIGFMFLHAVFKD